MDRRIIKKISLPIICFIFLAFVSSTGARMGLIISGGAPASGCSGSPFYSLLGDGGETNNDIKDSSADHWIGGEIVIGTQSDICQVDVRLSCKDNPGCTNNNYYIEIFAQSGADLGASQGTSATVQGNVSWVAGTWQAFTFSPAVTLSAGNYFFTITHDGAASSTTETIVYADENGATGYDQCAEWDSAGQNRTVPYSGDELVIKVYKTG
jgi:hypothetical protein